MPFGKMEISGSKKKSTYVVEQILTAINSGKYKVGDKLPPERVIAEQMGISRPPVREALGALKIKGLIESVTGDGTYVKQMVKDSQFISQTLAEVEEGVNLFEAFEARKGLEITAAELAIDRATSEDLKDIEDTLIKMQSILNSSDYDKYSEVNQDFHLSIAKAARNSFIEKIIALLLDSMNRQISQEVKHEYYSYLDSDNRHVKEYFKLHYQIFNAIKKKDKKLLNKEIVRHFNNSIYMRSKSSRV